MSYFQEILVSTEAWIPKAYATKALTSYQSLYVAGCSFRFDSSWRASKWRIGNERASEQSHMKKGSLTLSASASMSSKYEQKLASKWVGIGKQASDKKCASKRSATCKQQQMASLLFNLSCLKFFFCFGDWYMIGNDQASRLARKWARAQVGEQVSEQLGEQLSEQLDDRNWEPN